MSLRGSEKLRYASAFYCPKEPEVPNLLIYYPGTDGGNSQLNMYIISQSNFLLIIEHNADILYENYQYQSRRF
jgi:hypothetical protein